jgi:excinuclease ABC subunit A
VLQRLVDAGNTVLVIEHNLDVIKSCDWLIDLGPEGGDGGGNLVAVGTPEDLADVAASHTGQFLRPLLHEGRAVTVPANGTAYGLARSLANDGAAEERQRKSAPVSRERVAVS